MDFTGRTPVPQPAPAAPYSPAGSGRKSSRKSNNKWQVWGTSLLGLVVAVLIAAVVLLISLGGPKPESSYVDTNKLQAVFLNTGQVYFGDIKALNNQYLVLDNIYYLQTSSSNTASKSSAATSVKLVKLGCELHRPYDQMVINRSQVTFWENLQSDGQVAQAVATFQKNNPNGQTCSDQSTAGSTGSTNVQGSGSGSTSTNNSGTSTTNNSTTGNGTSTTTTK